MPRPLRRRRRLFQLHSLLIFCLIALSSIVLARTAHWLVKLKPAVLGVNSDITAARVLLETNQARMDQGLPGLQVSSQLSAAALNKGQDMLEQQYWSHLSPDDQQPWDFIRAAGYDYATAGENLARDFTNSTEMIQAWLNSPTHRANILSAQFEEVGMAVVQGKLDGVETTLVVQMFGAPAIVGSDQFVQTAQSSPVSPIVLPPAAGNPIVLELIETFFTAVLIGIPLTLLYDGLRRREEKARLETR